MLKGWQRKEVTTKCSDPTVVVTWVGYEFEIVEFQQVYLTTYKGERASTGTALDIIGVELHKSLEHEFQAEMEMNESDDDYCNYDRHIYGGE